MLASRLVEMIQRHAEELTLGVVSELEISPRTPSYRKLKRQDVQDRIARVLLNLGEWLDYKSDATTEQWYKKLGKERFDEGIPLSEVVFALLLTKQALRNFVRAQGLVDSAIELYQQIELYSMIGRFFDRAVYFTVRGYEEGSNLNTRPAGATQPAH